MTFYSNTFLVFLFFSFSTNLVFGQCPEGVNSLSNGKCIYLSWATPPSPLPSTVIEGGVSYTYDNSGTGTTSDPAIFLKGANCNGGSPSAYSGTLDIGGETCVFTAGALPVELVSFDLNYAEGVINLKWITASELSNAGFEMQRSSDGYEWEMLGWIAGAGNSVNTNSYSFLDENPQKGNSFYRIKQIDYDDSFKFSETISFKSNEKLLGFNITPNPSSGNVELNFEEEAESRKITLYNTIGKVVPLMFSDDNQFDVSNLAPGMYLIQVVSGRDRVTKKLQVQ